MGAYYARHNGEDQEVCTGIVEHYKPRFAGDDFPASIAGKAVSLADRLDAIVGSFGIGIQPTGSQAPYALRRQALGIVGMLMQDDRDLSLKALQEESYNIFLEQGISLEPLAKIMPALEDFFNQRIRYLLQEKGLRYDTVDAVWLRAGERPYSVMKKASSLAKKRGRRLYSLPFMLQYAVCICKKATGAAWAYSDLIDPSEIQLGKSLQEKEPFINEALGLRDFDGAYALAAQLVPQIEKLFDSVMIMVEDEKVRNARLGLLQGCVRLLSCIGELSLLA
jgi:glycyl-tRNA synthetase beta chain